MTGMFPDNGVSPTLTTNATTTASILAGCTSLFFKTGVCNPRFNPSSANAVISEILNAVTSLGGTYDCNVINNLAASLEVKLADITPFYTKDALATSTALQTGMRVSMLEYFAGSAGGGIGEVVNTGVADEGKLIALSGGKFWSKIEEDKPSLRDWGAKPDGTGNSSDAIQRAIDWAIPNQAFLSAPIGTYILDDPIAHDNTSDDSGFGLIGEGSITPRAGGSSTTRQSGVTFRASHTSRIFEFKGVENVVLENFELNSKPNSDRWDDYSGIVGAGDYSSSKDKEAIYITNATDAPTQRIDGPKIKNIYVRHQPGDAVRVIATNFMELNGVNASFCNGAGIINDDGSYTNTGVADPIIAYSSLSTIKSCNIANTQGPALFLGTHLTNTTATGGVRSHITNLETKYCGLDYEDPGAGTEKVQTVISGMNHVSLVSSAIASDVSSVPSGGAGLGILTHNAYNLAINSSRFVNLALPMAADALENLTMRDNTVVLSNGSWTDLIELRNTVGINRDFNIKKLIVSGHSVITGTDVIQNYFGPNYTDNTYFYGLLEFQTQYASGSRTSTSENATFIGEKGAGGAGAIEYRTGTGTPAQKRLLLENIGGEPHFDTTGTITVGGDAAMGADQTVAGNQVVTGDVSGAGRRYSQDIAINDQNVGYVSTPDVGGFFLIMMVHVTVPQAAVSGLFAYDAGSSLSLLDFVLGGSDIVNEGSTTLTGTTGADTKVNIAVEAGQIAIENRYGSNRVFSITFLG